MVEIKTKWILEHVTSFICNKMNVNQYKVHFPHFFFLILKGVIMQVYLSLKQIFWQLIRLCFQAPQTNIYRHIFFCSARNTIVEVWFKFPKMMSRSSNLHVIFCGSYFRCCTKISQKRFMKYRRRCIMTRTWTYLLNCHMATVSDACIYIPLEIVWIASSMVKLFIYLPSRYDKW